MLTGQLALMAATVFAGAAFYVSVAEHPARMLLDDRAALAQWKPAYTRGAAMQATLAIVGFLLGLAAWWQTGRMIWLIGAGFLIANWPYTLIGIMPTNHKLEATAPDDAGPQTRVLLEKWGTLHAGRTVLGIVAAILFLWATLN